MLYNILFMGWYVANASGNLRAPRYRLGCLYAIPHFCFMTFYFERNTSKFLSLFYLLPLTSKTQMLRSYLKGGAFLTSFAGSLYRLI